MTNRTKVVMLSGKAESGKSIISDGIIFEARGLGIKSTKVLFSGYLKYIAKTHYYWNGIKNEEGRHLLQWLGTDVIRKQNPEYWVDIVANFIRNFRNEFSLFVIEDFRFLNELEYMRYNPNFDILTIRVNRPNHVSRLTPEQLAHPSECELDNFKFDLVFENNGEMGRALNFSKDLVYNHPFFKVQNQRYP